MTRPVPEPRPTHPLARLLNPGTALRALVDQTAPDVAANLAIAARAESALADQAPVTGPEWPTTPEQITPEWLAAEVEHRNMTTGREQKRAVLDQLVRSALGLAYDALDAAAPAMLDQIGADLEGLVVVVSQALESAGPNVHTAADAITAGAHQQWAVITDARTDYDSLRTLQRAVMRCPTIEFDETICGGLNPAVTDPEARLYFHRNLDDVAPNWKGQTVNGTARGGTYPWPADPVERLAWFVRHDSGIWCPQPGQEKRRVDRRRPKPPRAAEHLPRFGTINTRTRHDHHTEPTTTHALISEHI